MRPASGIQRLSLNQATVRQWSLEELVAGCVDAGVPAVGLWREPVAQYGLDRAAKLVRDAGLAVTSLCRGGFLTATDPVEHSHALDDNRRAVEEAVEIAEQFPAGQVGVMVDTYHVWWDPQVYAGIARAGARIALFQVADWVTPLPQGALVGRGMLGDGCIELRRLRDTVDAAGYRSMIEVEIFSDRLWAMPGRQALDLVVERYRKHLPEP